MTKCKSTTNTCNKLEELWLHSIFECNLACSHCLFSCSPDKAGLGYLTLEEAVEATKDGIREGVRSVYVTGGEPLLWPHLRSFIQWFYDQKIPANFTILTNGTLVDSEWAKFFSLYPGLQLRISMECYTLEEHEKYRGKGSYHKAVQGMKNLNACGILPWVAYVNKSGQLTDPQASSALERDFTANLAQQHGLKIAGLKIIGAYFKGRLKGQVPVSPMEGSAGCCEKAIRDKLQSAQCAFGVAVSSEGVFPCPVMVDLPGARLGSRVRQVVRKPFPVNYIECDCCFTTGSTCGQ